MGGNAIRAFELARAVGGHVDVVLAAPRRRRYAAAGRGARAVRPRAARSTEGADRCGGRRRHCSPEAPRSRAGSRDPARRSSSISYDPGVLEALESGPARRSLRTMLAIDQLLDALHLGNHVICATERQRDLWIGAMMAPACWRPRPTTPIPRCARSSTSCRSACRRPRRRLTRRCDRAPLSAAGARRRDRPLERGHLELARSADRRPRGRCAGTTPPARPPRVHGAAAEGRRRRARGRRGARAGRQQPAPRPHRLLQRPLGSLRGARRLAARCGLRPLDASRAPRDPVRLPDPPARLPLGAPAGRLRPQATSWRSGSPGTTSAPPCRLQTWRPSWMHSTACSSAGDGRSPRRSPRRRTTWRGRRWQNR